MDARHVIERAAPELPIRRPRPSGNQLHWTDDCRRVADQMFAESVRRGEM